MSCKAATKSSTPSCQLPAHCLPAMDFAHGKEASNTNPSGQVNKNKLRIFKTYIMEKYYRNQQIIDGELDNHQVMMHIEKGKYFGLTPVGKRIWELINEPKTFSEITDQLLTEFDVEEDVCKQEVEEFLKKAKDADLVKIA